MIGSTEAIIAKLARFSRGFQQTTARVRISPDCVAEREGFEPSIQVLARITV